MGTQKVSRDVAISSTRAFLDELKVPERLREDVIDSYYKMWPVEDGTTKPTTFRSQVSVQLACLLMILEIERKDAQGHGEYMRLRGIAQKFTQDFVNPKGYASQFEGEPELYGIVNGLLVKMLEIYGDKERPTDKEQQPDTP